MQEINSLSLYEAWVPLRYRGGLPKNADLWGEVVTGAAGSEPVDLHGWRKPIHVHMANIPLTPRSLLTFTKLYGLLGKKPYETGLFSIDTREFDALQGLLRAAWRGDAAALKKIEAEIEAQLSVSATGIEVVTNDLWSFVRILFMRDYAARKTKVCANRECSHPYFLETHKGKIFCSRACGIFVGVRRYRARMAEREKR